MTLQTSGLSDKKFRMGSRGEHSSLKIPSFLISCASKYSLERMAGVRVVFFQHSLHARLFFLYTSTWPLEQNFGCSTSSNIFIGRESIYNEPTLYNGVQTDLEGPLEGPHLRFAACFSPSHQSCEEN